MLVVIRDKQGNVVQKNGWFNYSFEPNVKRSLGNPMLFESFQSAQNWLAGGNLGNPWEEDRPNYLIDEIKACLLLRKG